MDLTRRRLVQLSVGSAIALAAGGRATSAAAGDPTEAVRDDALRFYGGKGFAEVPPLGMLTDAAFNGGLRYDDTRPEPAAVPAVTVQTAARIDDIAKRSRPGVLAVFTILAINRPGPAEPAVLVADILDFLVDQRKLDPRRMLLVSTEQFRPLVDRLDRVNAGQVFERPIAEAQAAGDGSGFFAPSGHPLSPRLATVSVHYPLPDTAAGAAVTYPPEGYIEIAEIGIAPMGDDPGGPLVGGIGLERVAMAEGEAIPDFEQTRLNLLRIIEDEARRTGKDLPPGYTKFASL